MTERQALGIDINEYARTGGINYELVKKYFQRGEYDFLIIKAGLGIFQSPLFEEQKQNVEFLGIPYATYHLPDPREDMRTQARKYVDWVGTQERVYIVDIESPGEGQRPPNKEEVLRFVDELVKLTKVEPVLYSRVSILKEIGFLKEARQFRWWIAQYLWDRSRLPTIMQYEYFHDFLRDYAAMLPPSVHKSGIAENIILWQFSEKGNGPYYIYNLHTAHPKFTVGMKQADLNISIQGRTDFMRSFFGQAPASQGITPGEVETDLEIIEPTYADTTNQDMINWIYKAARPFTPDPWQDWIVRANLEHLAIPYDNRHKPYTGLKIEQIATWTSQEKAAILAAMHETSADVTFTGPTYPGKTNQDMINLIYKAARPFTVDPWRYWIVPAGLSFLGVPSGNRRQPYNGPRIEDLPHLTERAKAAILAFL
jgi:GH25 family lysozyme M1 (1,4-beta-N-acetylmuramidase)